MTTVLDRSYAGTRQAFVAALTGLPGVVAVYPHEPDGPTTEGAAWPVWIRTTYLTLGPACAAETEWEVVVVMPTGSKSASVGGSDAVAASVAAAIQSAGIGTCSWAEPRTLAAEMGGYPAIAIQVITATK